EVFQDLWETVWGAVQDAIDAVWGWIKKNWPLLLSILTGPIGAAVIWIVRHWEDVLGFFKGIPGKLKEFFSKVKDFITAPFRTAFNFIADAWNNTVGQLQWTVPDWVPGIGGTTVGAPKLPKFHNGGVVPGPPGAEVPI